MLLQLHMLSPYHCGYCSLLVWRIGIWGDGLKPCSVDSDRLGLCPVDPEKSVVSYHSQI
jgi:hypothetical protein